MSQMFRMVSSASQERLEKLITKMLKPGSDKEKIKKRIWNLFGEKWSIMFTDLSGFSRQVAEFGITHFLQIIYESQRIFSPIIESHDGIVIKQEGDSLLVIFRSPEEAVNCAIEMQHKTDVYNEQMEETLKIYLCVGIGYGEILKIGDQDVFGNEVNASSKLGEDIAKAHEILVTESVKQVMESKQGIGFELINEIPPGANAAFSLKY